MRARLAASALVGALLVGALSGCTFMTPQSTTVHYDASDGIGTSIGDLKVRNALLVTDDGANANLLINLVNTSNYGIETKIQYENATGAKVDDSVFVNADSAVTIGGADADTFTLAGISAPAGTLFPVFVQYGDVTGQQLWLPVLAPEGEYAGLAPDAATGK